MSWGPDAKGINGVYLGKNVIKCAGAVVTETLVKASAGGREGGGGWGGWGR